MDIRKIITKDSNEYGVILVENNEEIKVLMSCLHSPFIFDGLLENGWKFTGLPYYFEKDGVSIHNLPKVELDELGLSASEKTELMDAAFEMEKYKEVDLLSKKSVSDVNRYRFEKPNILINTREELLNFLDNYENLKLTDEDDIRFYMPLNSFVNRSALFTLEEYFDLSNAKYRRIIENRRSLTVSNFLQLEKGLEAVSNLPEKHSVLDLMEAYFSWGICGIKFEEIEKERKSLQYDILSYGSPTKSKIKEKKLSYIDNKGNIFIHDAERGSEWKPCSLEYAKEIYIKKFITDYQYDKSVTGIAPALLERDIIEEVIHIAGINVDIFINDYNIVMLRRDSNSSKGEDFCSSVALEIVAGGLSYEIKDIVEKNFKRCFEDIVLNSCIKDFEERITVKIDQSSYKLMKRLGGSLMSLVNKIISKDPELVMDLTVNRVDSTTAVDVKTLGKADFIQLGGLSNNQFIKKCKLFIKDELPENDLHYKDIALFLSEVIAGDINIDALDSGIISDAYTHYNEYKKYIRIAINYMGYTVKEVIDLLSDVNMNMEYVMFDKNGMEMYMPITKKNRKFLGYKQDFMDYQLQAAKTAGMYIWVDSILQEYHTTLGLGKQRHVGVTGKVIYFARDTRIDSVTERRVRGEGDLNRARLKNTFNILNEFIDNKIRSLRTEYTFGQTVEQSEQNERLAEWLNSMRDIEISRMMFELHYEKVAHLNEKVGGDALDSMASELCSNEVDSVIRSFCDSTVILTTNLVNANGIFAWFCPNASITDFYVVPKSNYEIREVPFYAGFQSTKGEPGDSLYDLFRKKGVIPKGYFGFSAGYKRFCYPTGELRNLETSYDSLKFYNTNSWALKRRYDNTGKGFINPPHPAEMLFSGLYPKNLELIPHEGACSFVIDENPNKEKLPTLTKALAIDKYAECRSLFEEAKYEIEGAKSGFYEFDYLRPDDYYNFDTYQKVLDLQKFSGRYILKVFNNKNAVLDTGEMISFEDIPRLYESGEYRINRISGDRYLIETFFGNLFECRCA